MQIVVAAPGSRGDVAPRSVWPAGCRRVGANPGFADR